MCAIGVLSMLDEKNQKESNVNKFVSKLSCRELHPEKLCSINLSISFSFVDRVKGKLYPYGLKVFMKNLLKFTYYKNIIIFTQFPMGKQSGDVYWHFVKHMPCSIMARKRPWVTGFFQVYFYRYVIIVSRAKKTMRNAEKICLDKSPRMRKGCNHHLISGIATSFYQGGSSRPLIKQIGQ